MYTIDVNGFIINVKKDPNGVVLGLNNSLYFSLVKPGNLLRLEEGKWLLMDTSKMTHAIKPKDFLDKASLDLSQLITEYKVGGKNLHLEYDEMFFIQALVYDLINEINIDWLPGKNIKFGEEYIEIRDDNSKISYYEYPRKFYTMEEFVAAPDVPGSMVSTPVSKVSMAGLKIPPPVPVSKVLKIPPPVPVSKVLKIPPPVPVSKVSPPVPAPKLPPVVPSPAPKLPPVIPSPAPKLPPVIPSPAPKLPPVVPSPAPKLPPVVPSPVPKLPPVVPSPAPKLPPVVPSPVPKLPPVVPSPAPKLPPIIPSPAPKLPPVIPSPAPKLPPVVPSPAPKLPPVPMVSSPKEEEGPFALYKRLANMTEEERKKDMEINPSAYIKGRHYMEITTEEMTDDSVDTTE